MNTPRQKLEQAKAFAEIHLKECSLELIEWNRTSILKEDGFVRQLARIRSDVPEYMRLTVAQNVIHAAALQYVAEHTFGDD